MSAYVGGGVMLRGRLETPTRSVDLARVRSMWYRRPSGFVFPHLQEQDARFAVAQARYGVGGVLASLPGCLYVNHPNRIGDAEYKPAGLAAAVMVGFDVPATLITSNPDNARSFVKDHGAVICKPIAAPTYLVDGVSQVMAVSQVEADEIDDGLSGTTHLLQARVAKAADVRVTVIGRHVFAVRIDSDPLLLDWRENYALLSYRVVDVPPRIEQALHAYLKYFGLVFGAFDLAISDDGGWHWIECNPSGNWAWLEAETGLPMTSALADLLERGTG